MNGTDGLNDLLTKIRESLRYGDVKAISNKMHEDGHKRCSYQVVQKVLNGEKHNIDILEYAVSYIEDRNQREVELYERIEKSIGATL